MRLIALWIYWSSLALITYVYIGYPLVLWLLSRFRLLPAEKDPEEWPTISMIIAAYNEELVLEAKLNNSLELDYPKDLLQILVASDGSDDQTDEIVQRFHPKGVELVRVDGRLGKTTCQNRAVERCRGDLIVFSDANALYNRSALKQLARPFQDQSVGCVEGRRMDHCENKSATGSHELTYRDYESWIKQMEGRVLSCTGATGPIYAVRRELYVPLEGHMISDLMEPLLIMLNYGKRQVFNAGAVSSEAVLVEMGREFSRKTRIITRCLNSITNTKGLLNPMRTGFFALQIWSHRLLRWLVPVLALLLLIANLFLLAETWYTTSLGIILGFLALALIGYMLDRLNAGHGILRLPYYFVVANLAALTSIVFWLSGRNYNIWNPDRTND